ncbi:outer membrane beta-barrel protein [Pedobacter insulae]|uniref:outer membrane beta-barrel protein n=1 Tax=Pedobacter insulae TaxID=414048 RepID=UPI0015A65DD3|nr:outer membrane beta-barrel protein [Pedobacter insulae]
MNIFILLLFAAQSGFGQTSRRISGLVTDSTENGLSHANVILIAGKDTLQTTTNEEGYFNFSKIKAESFLLQINCLGYQSYSNTYDFAKGKLLEIKRIELKQTPNMLKTVEIKGKPNPIRIMQDTIEYNAAAYQVFEGDNVADLIKQFPGMEVDDQYNVKTMGQEMTKLRINGKDFFTNNIKDFIGKLPAGIVSKIQIIDDFGDEANFTGIKVGEPKKMLNIVTKPGMNKGKFGSTGMNGGTNQQYGGSGSFSFWNDSKQRMADIGYHTSNNGAGTSENARVTLNHRDKLGKYGNFSISNGFNTNNNAFESEQAVETINPLGTFYNNSQNKGKSNRSSNIFNSSYTFNNKKIRLSANFGGTLSQNSNTSASFNNQTGVIRQDLKNNNQLSSKSPSLNGNLSLAKILKNKKNSFSTNLAFSTSPTNSNQNISTNTLYYDRDTELLKKDSLLNRNLITSGSNQYINFGLNYSLGLKTPSDTLAKSSLNFTYNASVGKSNSNRTTFVLENAIPIFIDSLSTHYTSVFINQSLGMSYSYSNKKMRYNFGFNARPSLMSNNYINLNQKIKNNNLNYAPNINLSRTIVKGKTISLSYTGNNNAPSIDQIQPIRNTQNLQNIVIGNPNLKPYFRHSLMSNYNYVNIKSGISLQAGFTFSATQNEIVSNVILVPDTLNSLKQETRFENINGTYNAGNNYSLNIPIKKNKYAISYGGNLGLSNRAIFINNNKRFNKGFNFSQNVRGSINLKKLTVSASTNYNFTSNTNVLNTNNISDLYYLNLGQIGGTTLFNTHTYAANLNGSLRLKKLVVTANIDYNATNSDAEFNANAPRNIKNLNLAFSTRLTIKKRFLFAVNTSKTINKGYSLANANPLIINTSLTAGFLKNKMLNLKISADDLLNQGNNLSRYISGNSIIDSRTNQVTRVFKIGLSYSLSSFGGNVFRVDAD